MRKYYRSLNAKPGQLRAGWAKEKGEEPQLVIAWGDGCQKRDGAVLSEALSEIMPYLKDRGYDLTTLCFSIMRKEAGDGR